MSKSKVFLAILLLISNGYAFAASSQPACPTPDAIQGQGLSSAYLSQINQKNYVVSQHSQYGTNKKWVVAVGAFEASSEDDAIDQGQLALRNLSLMSDPVYDSVNDRWTCVYSAKSPRDRKSYMAVAVTPVPADAGFIINII